MLSTPALAIPDASPSCHEPGVRVFSSPTTLPRCQKHSKVRSSAEWPGNHHLCFVIRWLMLETG